MWDEDKINDEAEDDCKGDDFFQHLGGRIPPQEDAVLRLSVAVPDLWGLCLQQRLGTSWVG